MTTKMQGLRPKPLLDAPGNVEWLELRQDDIQHVVDMLVEARGKNDILTLKNTHLVLKGASHPQQVTESDKKIVTQLLGDRDIFGYAMDLSELSELGVTEDLSGERKGQINEFLRSCEGEDENALDKQSHLLTFLRCLKKIGYDAEVSEANKEALNKLLEWQRRGPSEALPHTLMDRRELDMSSDMSEDEVKRLMSNMARHRFLEVENADELGRYVMAETIAALYASLKQYGVEIKLNPSDVEFMRERFRELRNRGEHLRLMNYYNTLTKILKPAEEKADVGEMPPLKKL